MPRTLPIVADCEMLVADCEVHQAYLNWQQCGLRSHALVAFPSTAHFRQQIALLFQPIRERARSQSVARLAGNMRRRTSDTFDLKPFAEVGPISWHQTTAALATPPPSSPTSLRLLASLPFGQAF